MSDDLGPVGSKDAELGCPFVRDADEVAKLPHDVPKIRSLDFLPAERSLGCVQLLAPAHDGCQALRSSRRDPGADAPAAYLRGQAPKLVIRRSRPANPELLFEDAVLIDQ